MMKKTKKLLAILCASICVTGTVGIISGCEILSGLFPSEETATLAFKNNFPANLTLNVSVDISQYVEYEKGQSLTMTAEYTDANGVKKSYEPLVLPLCLRNWAR